MNETVTSKDISRLLQLRQRMKRKRPKFLHQEHWKLKRFRKASWRKPKGKGSKMRAKEKAKPALVNIGYRGPKKVRGLHPKGVPEVLVRTVQDIERIQKEREKGTKEIEKGKIKEKGKEQRKKKRGKKKRYTKGKAVNYVIKVASAVGTRKKLEIVKAAAKYNLYVANPSIPFAKISTMEELESLIPIKKYITAWYISSKVPEEEREELGSRAEEAGIEVMEWT
ncbi:MAG: hypothetical protein HXS46_08320 [Theionarchaea archaeon]|nr:MAG: hypothetical protein AYK18_05785 [Theionarchaea archaeon DG-70]MBU7010681.1 hypothetical protein [Theionarchaea archaeon]